MATRFYLPAGGSTAPVAPAYSAYWTSTTSAARKGLGGHRYGTALTDTTVTDAVTTNPFNALARQFVSQPLAAQTISGNFTAVLRGLESNAAADSMLTVVMSVVSNDGTVVRGVLYAGVTAALNATAGALGQEWNTAAGTRIIPSTALSSITAIAGDRIVVEIGTRFTNTVATSYVATHRFGDAAATDFALTAALTTDLNPWIEFATTLSFPKAATQVDDFGIDRTQSIWQSSYNYVISGGVGTCTDTGAAYSAIDSGAGDGGPGVLLDLTGSYFSAKMTTPSTGVGAFSEVTLTEPSQADGQAMQFEWTAGTLTCRNRNASYGDIDTSATLAVSAGATIWCGYAEGTGAARFGGTGTAGSVYWFTSTDGITWTLQKTSSGANVQTWVSKARATLGCHNTSGTSSAVFDQVNLLPGPQIVTGTAGVDYATVVSATNVTSLTCAKPTGVVNGDLLLAFVWEQVAFTSGQDFGLPSGWTRISTAPVADGFQRPLGLYALPVPSASALSATTFAFTSPQTGRMGVAIFRVTGANLASVADQAGAWTSTGQTTTAAMGAITPAARALVIAACHATGTAAQSFPQWFGPPAGFLAQAVVNTSPPSGSASNDGLWVASSLSLASATTGTVTETVSTQTALTGVLTSIKPVATGPASLTATATDSSSPSDTAVRAALARTRTAADSSSPSDVANGPGVKARTATDSSTPGDTAVRATIARTRAATDGTTPADIAARTAQALTRSSADVSAPSDTAVRAVLAEVRTASDSSTPSDAASGPGGRARTATDVSTPSDAASRVVTRSLAAADTSGPADAATRSLGAARTVSSTTAPSDTVGRGLTLARSSTDASAPMDAAVGTGKGQVTASDISVSSDVAIRVLHLVPRTASDTGGPADLAGIRLFLARTATDATFGSDTATVATVSGQVRTASDSSIPGDVATRSLLVLVRIAIDALAGADHADAVVHPIGGSTAFGRPSHTTTVTGPVGHAVVQQVSASTVVHGNALLVSTTVG